jgi:hypothetical protein
VLTWTITYAAIAVTVSQANLITALEALPRSASLEADADLVLMSDTTGAGVGPRALRTIEFTVGPNSMFTDADVAPFLTNLYTRQFSLGLACPIEATAPVGV